MLAATVRNASSNGLLAAAGTPSFVPEGTRRWPAVITGSVGDACSEEIPARRPWREQCAEQCGGWRRQRASLGGWRRGVARRGPAPLAGWHLLAPEVLLLLHRRRELRLHLRCKLRLCLRLPGPLGGCGCPASSHCGQWLVSVGAFAARGSARTRCERSLLSVRSPLRLLLLLLLLLCRGHGCRLCEVLLLLLLLLALRSAGPPRRSAAQRSGQPPSSAAGWRGTAAAVASVSACLAPVSCRA
jgi:hypothetical protein